MTRFPTQRFVNILAILATIGVNWLANALPLNGQQTGEISDRFQVFFVPAGYVFAIWGVIYLGLIAFAVYQALPAQRDNPRLARIGWLFALSCLANIGWLFLWHYNQFVWTVGAMLALLGLLIAIYTRLGIGRVSVSSAERWSVQIPFSIYLGWVSVATIANITSTLDYLAWSGWGIGDAVWAVIMLAVATVLTFLVYQARRDVAFALVIIWAFVGIAVKQSSAPLVFISALLLAALVAALLIGGMIQGWRSRQGALSAGA